MDELGVIQLRIIDQLLVQKNLLNIFIISFRKFVNTETEGRVKITKVKFMEHGKNAAYYIGD